MTMRFPGHVVSSGAVNNGGGGGGTTYDLRSARSRYRSPPQPDNGTTDSGGLTPAVRTLGMMGDCN